MASKSNKFQSILQALVTPLGLDKRFHKRHAKDEFICFISTMKSLQRDVGDLQSKDRLGMLPNLKGPHEFGRKC